MIPNSVIVETEPDNIRGKGAVNPKGMQILVISVAQGGMKSEMDAKSKYAYKSQSRWGTEDFTY